MSLVDPEHVTDPANAPTGPQHHPDIPTIGPLAGSWTWDVEQDQWWWSEEMYVIHGFQPGEIVPTRELLLSHKHPEDRAKSERVFTTAVELAGPFSNYHRILDAHQKLRHVLTVGSGTADATGRVVRVSGFMVDLTAARREDLQPTIRETIDRVLEHRSAIEMAKGAIMAGYGTDPDAAFDILRSASSNANVKVRDLAHRLVEMLSSATGPVDRERLDQVLHSRSGPADDLDARTADG